jgi:hypothetical protein
MKWGLLLLAAALLASISATEAGKTKENKNIQVVEAEDLTIDEYLDLKTGVVVVLEGLSSFLLYRCAPRPRSPSTRRDHHCGSKPHHPSDPGECHVLARLDCGGVFFLSNTSGRKTTRQRLCAWTSLTPRVRCSKNFTLSSAKAKARAPG